MKLKVPAILLVVVMPLFLVGCATIPEKTPDNQCMLVIHQNRSGQYRSYMTFYIYVDNEETPMLNFRAGDKYILLEGLEPGVHRINKVTYKDDRESGQRTMPNSSFRFVLKEGYITILEKSLITKIQTVHRQSNTVWYSQNSRFLPLTSEYLEELLEEIRSQDPNAMWKF